MQLVKLIRLGCALLFSFFMSASWAAEIIYTIPGEEYSTIEEALEAIGDEPFVADTSYVIEVEPGTYRLNVTIPADNITLRGKVTSRTLLKSDNDSEDTINPIIAIDFANNVTIENFTFIDSDLAISIYDVQEGVNIRFNVFNMGLDNTAISFVNNSPVSIKNNTFYKNDAAIDSIDSLVRVDANLLSIVNNIFSENDLAISTQIIDTKISYSCLFNNTNDGAIGFSSTVGNPLFVHAPENSNDDIYDFHLKSDSACIDVGDDIGAGDTITDDDIDDVGAFGGATLDNHPYPVLNAVADNVTATSSDELTYSLSLSWDANESYVMQKDLDTVGSYKVYYANQRFTQEEVTTNQITSQVETITSTTLTDIASTVVTPSSPVGITASISTQLITVSWDAVSNTTGYYVHYGIDSTTENTSNLMTTTSFDITDVANNQAYQIAVTAVTQETLYYAVSVIDAYGNESYFEESLVQSQVLGIELVSELSDTVTAIPEEVVGYPALPNKACFLASLEVYSDTDLNRIRAYRDNVLNENIAGQFLVELYYLASPIMVSFVERNPAVKSVLVDVIALILPMVFFDLENYILLLMIVLSLFIVSIPFYRMAL